MSVAEAIYDLLSTDKTLGGLLAKPDSVFQYFAPDDAPGPYIVFSMHTGVETWSFRNFFRNQLWVVKGVCRGSDPTRAQEIDTRCEELLNDASLETGDHLLYLRRESDINFGEIGGGTLVAECGGVYRIYTEPITEPA